MQFGLIGALTTPDVGNVLEPDVPWALDNGCFSERWNETKWMACLAKYVDTPNCLFAVVPDVVCDSAATDQRWRRYAPIVRDHGYRTAYVTQNGCQHVPPNADVVFTGGDNHWKMSDQAHHLTIGRTSHMGRVNSLRRLQLAAALDYDTADGTMLAFGPDTNLPKLLRYLRITNQQPTLTQ